MTIRRTTLPRTLTRTAALATAALLTGLPLAATAATLPTTGSTVSTTPQATAPTDEGGEASLLLLLDASRSMEDPDATGTPKIEAARTALGQVIEGLDPTQSVGLRVFGGTVPVDQPTEAKCTDSQLVVPIGTDNTDQLSAAVADYTPTGETPIGYALQQAADDLGPDGNRTIVLVSDGIATCDPDPCEVADQLTADGLDLVVHTVGLGADDATRTQLQCIADTAGGTYYDATDTDTLTTALTRISTRAFKTFAVAGTPVEGTPTPAAAPELRQGQYTDTLAANDEVKHYLLRRALAGSTLHVGLAAKAGPDQGAFVDLAVRTVDGEECASDSASTFEGQSVPLLWSGLRVMGDDPSAGGDGCSAAEELVLSVAPREYGSWMSRDLFGVPVELVVVEEPPAAPGALPDSPDLPVWQPMNPSTERETVVGGSSFNDAPLLEPGRSYDTDILVGEVLFFRVPATFGQQVQAQLDSELMSGPVADYLGEHGKVSAHLTVISPERADVDAFLPGDQVDADGLAQFGATETDRAVASSGQILYLNRFAGGIDPRSATEGDYYVAVTAGNPNLSGSHAVPFVLTVDVVGEPAGAPDYVETSFGAAPSDDATVTTSAATPTPPDPADGKDPERAEDLGTQAAEPSAPADAAQEEAGMPWAWVLGGLGVVVAGAGVVLLAARRRHPG